MLIQILIDITYILMTLRNDIESSISFIDRSKLSK